MNKPAVSFTPVHSHKGNLYFNVCVNGWHSAGDLCWEKQSNCSCAVKPKEGASLKGLGIS